MPALTEERARVLAVVRALKAVGVRVRNWKSFLHSEKTPEHETPQQQLFAFGRDVQLLPQCQVAEADGSVPLFLVEACEYLSQHIHTEGIFRKTGSLCRIRALRSDLEKGKRIFLPPHDALLQPCDVASVLKQFLRELPEPLIAGELQVALCHAQTLETGASERATLLLTSLLPPVHIHTLRYFCSFLRRVAHRCDENRMEVSNLALVMAPNLLPCSPQSCRLTVLTEKQLEQQAAAIRILIVHAERIGVVPSFVLDTLGAAEASDSTPPLEGALLNKRARLGVYSSLCRQRRRSVGEMFVDAFSKLKPSRTHTVPPLSLDASSGPSLSPTPQSPTTVKRKVSEDDAPEAIGSARKRRSLHDLRADLQSISSQSTDDLTEGPSPEKVKSSDESQRSVSETTGKIRAQRKSLRAPKQEDRARRRRRSLRFFSVSSNSESPQVLSVTPCSDSETCLRSCKKLHINKKALFSSDSDSSLKIPLILIEEPGRVVIGSEVDDDPELLNCSFIENPDYVSGSESEESLRGRQQQESEQVQDDDHWVLLDDGNPDVIVEYKMNHSQREDVESLKTEGGVKVEEQETVTHNKPRKKKNISQKRSGPRRSISMPEVALDSPSDKVDEVQQEAGPTFYDEMWSTSVSLPLKRSGGKGKEGRELRRRRYGTFHEQQKKEKGPDSDLKKANFRLSMAERFRSFSALASFLRTPTVRLRRQGARRFSRSFSDEAVQEDQQAFLELNDELTDSEEPNEELRPEHLPSPSTPSSPSEDQTLIGSSQKSENDENQQINECVMLQMLKVEKFNLDQMFEQQCHISEEYMRHSDSYWDVQLDGSTPSSQRRALFTSPEDSSAFTASETEPQREASPCNTFDCLSFDGVFSISSVSEKCSMSLDLSPPTFQFRPPASRRHYRDSPRWPSHQVRMSTFKPLPF